MESGAISMEFSGSDCLILKLSLKRKRMPIVYSVEHKGWGLVDATPEELDEIQRIGIDTLTHNFSAHVIRQAMEMAKEEEGIPEGVTTQ